MKESERRGLGLIYLFFRFICFHLLIAKKKKKKEESKSSRKK